MYVLSTPFARNTPNTLQLRCLMKRVWAKLSSTTLYIWSARCTPLCIQLPFSRRQIPPDEVPPELKFNENSKVKMRARVFVAVVKMVFFPETKTFQAKQLCLLCGCKNDGNAVARSILLVSQIVRKIGPIKMKN
jgi:hypothetical protein